MPSTGSTVESAPAVPYQQPPIADPAALFGHYAPSRARVQLLLEYALAHEHDAFWRALARRLRAPSGAPPWNEAIAAAQDVGIEWSTQARVRRIVYGVLYEGRIAGRHKAAAFDDPGMSQ